MSSRESKDRNLQQKCHRGVVYSMVTIINNSKGYIWKSLKVNVKSFSSQESILELCMGTDVNQTYRGDHFCNIYKIIFYIFANIKSSCCTPEANIKLYVSYIFHKQIRRQLNIPIPRDLWLLLLKQPQKWCYIKSPLKESESSRRLGINVKSMCKWDSSCIAVQVTAGISKNYWG